MISPSGDVGCLICNMRNADACLSDSKFDDIPEPFGSRGQGSIKPTMTFGRMVKVNCSSQHTYHLHCLQKYNEDIQREKENTQADSVAVKTGFFGRFREVFSFSDKCVSFPSYIGVSNDSTCLIMDYRASQVPAGIRREIKKYSNIFFDFFNKNILKGERSETWIELKCISLATHNSMTVVSPAIQSLLSGAGNKTSISELYHCPACGTDKKVSVLLEDGEIDQLLIQYDSEKVKNSS